jgi:hypothetical protein
MAHSSPLINLFSRLSEESKKVVDDALVRLGDAEYDIRKGLQHLVENRGEEQRPKTTTADSGQSPLTSTG